VLVLQLDGHLDESVLMLPLFVMSVAVMLMAAVLVVLMFLMSAHTAPSLSSLERKIQKLTKSNCCLSQSRKGRKEDVNRFKIQDSRFKT
jgi:hypothetical protein